jgi:multisubunit Na+/H+ antiporter MnhB subunit
MLKQGVVNGVVNGVVRVSLTILLVFLLFRDPTPELPRSALAMLGTFYLGILFACAYLMKERLWIFQALSFVSEKLSYPGRREMNLVYSVSFFAVTAFLFVRFLNEG